MGGVFNTGLLSLDSTSLQSNATGSGGTSHTTGFWGGSGGLGGGLYNESEANLWNSPVTGNTTGNGSGSEAASSGGSGGLGGGIYNKGSLDLAFSPVLSNTTGSGGAGRIPGPGGSGGGIGNTGTLEIRFSSISGNITGQGGSGQLSSPSGKDGNGGGLYSEGSLSLIGATVIKNRTGSGGSNPTSFAGDGGGLYISNQGQITLSNAIIAENSIGLSGKGSGMYLVSSANLLHTTLAHNTGGDGSGLTVISSTVNLTNTILVSQTVGITSTTGIIHLDSTLWGSGDWANLTDMGGSGTFTHTHDWSGDPAFVDPTNNDYHILPSSAAIDRGLPTSVDNDVDNQPRPNPSTSLPDLGADEYWLLVPINQVNINGRWVVSATMPISYTATVFPENATPNFVYAWSPHPAVGQGTDNPFFTWSTPGNYTVTVTAKNAGSSAMASHLVLVVPGPIRKMFFPVIMENSNP